MDHASVPLRLFSVGRRPGSARFRIAGAGAGGYLPHPPTLAAPVGRAPSPGPDRSMKLRAALLLACMITVPMLAMFSHKVSASTRQAIRKRIWDPMIDSAATSLGWSDGAATRSGAAATGVDSLAAGMPGTVHGDPGQASTEGSDRFPGAEAPPPVTPMFADRPRSPDPAVALPPAADTLPSAGPAVGVAGDLSSLEARLRALGATGIEWTPAQGGDGMHRCRCRIPADPSGQLQRVFQASAADPVAALDSLVGQVTAWSLRTRVDADPGRIDR